MNFEDFLNNKLIAPADFNIGGVRVSGATLDFSGIEDEAIWNKGLRKILIDLQNEAKNQCADGIDHKEKDKAKYLERLNVLASEYSGSTINMSGFISAKTSWNFEKGLEADPLKKATKLADKMDEAELLELQASIAERLKK